MDARSLKELLDAVAQGSMAPEGAFAQLQDLPFADLGFAKIDHHRMLRKGYPETIFCQGKTPEQIVAIVTEMRKRGSTVYGTRCSPEGIQAVLAAHPDANRYELARAFSIDGIKPEPLDGIIAVVCAGTSDIPVAEEACITAELMGNQVDRIYDVGVAGLHRLLSQRDRLLKARVIICCAGMEGALPSVVGGLVQCPVIAVPTSVGYGASFNGVAALLGMLNSCATGLTVVNIDNGFGAAAAATAINRVANGLLQ
ncbi:MAG: nickel pincer cofactor biosynthesis protein LarB [Candidatus Hydrogenedentes bacterium]|nr:nickel pincer cofactor biosynthesis protein LarB [Candidatus Hydrogenedentota bacterium]